MSINFMMSAVAVPPLKAVGPPVVTLSTLRAGARARLLAVDEPGELGDRLLELGLTPGVTVTLVRRGLFGDPLLIEVRGSMLSLRARQAHAIRVVLLGE